MLWELLAISTAVHAAEFHVATTGCDRDSGAKHAPFRTIQRAADLAQPGDVITVHEGVYRERINPPRGGDSDEKRIVYQAASGEAVVIKGSEVVRGWEKVRGDVWKVVLPNSFFGDFNPYADVIGGEWYRTPADGYDRHTGAVYLNGEWLDEAATLVQALAPRNTGTGSVDAAKDSVLGGETAGYRGQAIAGTTEDTLYQTCRYNLKGYRLSVPDGTYRVTLKFCEPHFDSSGKRVCDIRLQGRTVLGRFDIFAKAGKFTAHDEIVENVAVTDGLLTVDISNRVSMACISAIVIENAHYSKKLNCGGPAWNDYRPDALPGGVGVTGDRPLWKAEVDEQNTTIWAQFEGADPNGALVEINVRQSVFYPSEPGRNFITVRGFTMRHAATPWAGAMSEQVGLIGTHWSKGWIIEDNEVSHSMNTGITLGRYDLARYGIAMPPATAPGFVESCELALRHGWSKENIGGHVVRHNRISHCEKNGIHGSLGGIFSTIEGNTIGDIAVKGWVGGPDLAGLKLLGSVDTLIKDNHIHRCGGSAGLWLDWMAQGTRVTGNLLHGNPAVDLFMEVDHGPFLIDHNLFLSGRSLRDWSQGGAYAHNLFAGTLEARAESRQTPYFAPHTVTNMRLADIRKTDFRFHNNLFAGGNGAAGFNAWAANLRASGNVYLAGANPCAGEEGTVIAPGFHPNVSLTERPAGEWWLEMAVDPAWLSAPTRSAVTTVLLGAAVVPDARFEQPDAKPYRLDKDYTGTVRDAANPAPGPFEFPGEPVIRLKVWPRAEGPRYYRTVEAQAPVTMDCEVAVYGGTPAGVTAAMQAARMGRKTLLLSFNRTWGDDLRYGKLKERLLADGQVLEYRDARR